MAWLLVSLLLIAGGLGLYKERAAVVRYYHTPFTVSPHILVLTSDDWGGMGTPIGNGPDDRPQDVTELMRTLEPFRDSYGRRPVLTVYMTPAMPDFQAIKASGYTRYSSRFAYDDRPEMVALWRKLIAEGRVEIGLHGCEHWNGPLYMELLQKEPAYRKALDDGRIPFRDDAYWACCKSDGRLEYLCRTYIDTDGGQIRSPSLERQRRITREGLDLIERNLGVRPTAVVAPGHVYDEVTCRALAMEGVEFLETPVRPIVQVDDHRRRTDSTDDTAHGLRVEGVGIVIRTDDYEPAWQKVRVGPQETYWEVRRNFECGIPVVLSAHKASFSSHSAEDERYRRELAEILRMVQAEYPDVAFLGASDLGHYMHGQGDRAGRKIEFRRQELATFDRICITGKALWFCHFKFRVWVYILAAAVMWALVRTVMSWRPRRGRSEEPQVPSAGGKLQTALST